MHLPHNAVYRAVTSLDVWGAVPPIRNLATADIVCVLGYTHALTGATTWLVVAPPLAEAMSRSLTPVELGAGTLACAGAALVPDLDHPQATVSRTFGPVSQSVARFTQLVSGGHRHATHSFLFAGMAGVAAWLMAVAGEWWAWGLMFVLAAFAIRALGLLPRRWSGNGKSIFVMLEAALVTGLLHYGGVADWWWLGPAMTVGCLAHIGPLAIPPAADFCTPERVPLFWPIKKRLGFPLIAHTGNWAETKIIAPATTLLLLALIYWRFISPVI